MDVLDSSGCVKRTPEVAERLRQLVLAEPEIMSVATGVELDAQQWGQSGLHFSARLIEHGEPALLKVNVAVDQLWWTRTLARAHPALLPRVYASGQRLADEPLGWVLWERVAGGLHPGWQGREFELLLEAGVRFQLAARALAAQADAAGATRELHMADLAERMEAGIRRGAPGPAERVWDRLSQDWEWVAAVCETELCHGDLHLANVLCREQPPEGEALLIDHHPTRMPWACEAARLEILNAEPARRGCRGLVAQAAAIRARFGLHAPLGADLERLQAIVLGWWAIDLWGVIGSAPDPAWRDPRVWHDENARYIAVAVSS